MKKTLSAIAATAVLAGCCQSTAVKFTLTGSDPLFENGKYIYVQDENGKTGDSVQIADHGFTIKGERPYPEQAYLSIDREQIGSDFFLEDGTIRVERHGDTAEDFIYTGTPRNDRYNAILRQNEALYDSGRPALQIKQAQDSLLRAAVAQNPNILGLTLLKDDLLYTLSAPEIRQFADAFPESFQRHPYMLELRKFVENLRADIGKPYIDITGQTPGGDTVSLTATVRKPGNRYVLLDFCARWCGYCRAEFPNLAALYGKYHDRGFDIFGISYDSNHKQWLECIEAYDMRWTQVTPGYGIPPRQTQAWQDYSLGGIPSYFLIDCSTGKIIAKQLRGEALARKIAELLD